MCPLIPKSHGYALQKFAKKQFNLSTNLVLLAEGIKTRLRLRKAEKYLNYLDFKFFDGFTFNLTGKHALKSNSSQISKVFGAK